MILQTGGFARSYFNEVESAVPGFLYGVPCIHYAEGLSVVGNYTN